LKGVVLAGGLGTRLRPLTSVTNKHLLPVYNQPMIYYPIQTLVNAGITDIMVVTGGSSAGEFLRLLGNGKAFGLKHLNYAYQEGEGGIADALSLVEHFASDDAVCVVLGDNIIEGNIRGAVEAYRDVGGWDSARTMRWIEKVLAETDLLDGKTADAWNRAEILIALNRLLGQYETM